MLKGSNLGYLKFIVVMPYAAMNIDVNLTIICVSKYFSNLTKFKGIQRSGQWVIYDVTTKFHLLQ